MLKLRIKTFVTKYSIYFCANVIPYHTTNNTTGCLFTIDKYYFWVDFFLRGNVGIFMNFGFILIVTINNKKQKTAKFEEKNVYCN